MTAARVSSSLPEIYERLDAFRKAAGHVILDKDREIALTLCCLIADGHLLIEDVPGVGKTTLVKTIARLMNLESSRIQFTNDMLPADIVGSSIFDEEKRAFSFHRGPIFAQTVLADELNRATPKTQSACLQAMEERKITVDGITHSLPNPFFLIATQNPRQQIGTFPLPESQLDRFLMRVELGYPSRAAEKKLLLGESRLLMVEDLEPVFNPLDLLEIQKAGRAVHVSESIVNYIQDLVAKSRENVSVGRGLSPRGSLNLVHASQAWALLQRRQMVLPEDVQAIAIPVMSHRLNPTDDLSGATGLRIAEDILASVRVD
ncbi:MAG: MoxR family ATPase [Proteobacteria bacterium]|nr:MAG: MoxR family ATPase [Pseudomonadota bacterium]